MKRLKTVLGRSGTTIIAISLALLLVSVVPQPQFSRSAGSAPISPEQFSIVFTQQDLTPQQELEITVTVDGTVKLYLLEISNQVQFVIFGDAEFNFTDIEESARQLEIGVQEILDEHPEKIIWEREIQAGHYSQRYSPTKVINATLVIYNTSPEMVHVEHSVSLKSSLAPTEKVQTIAYVAAPVGVILALPWILNMRKQRKQS